MTEIINWDDKLSLIQLPSSKTIETEYRETIYLRIENVLVSFQKHHKAPSHPELSDCQLLITNLRLILIRGDNCTGHCIFIKNISKAKSCSYFHIKSKRIHISCLKNSSDVWIKFLGNNRNDKKRALYYIHLALIQKDWLKPVKNTSKHVTFQLQEKDLKDMHQKIRCARVHASRIERAYRKTCTESNIKGDQTLWEEYVAQLCVLTSLQHESYKLKEELKAINIRDKQRCFES